MPGSYGLDISGGFKRILEQMDYKQEGQFWKFILGFFLLVQLSGVNDTRRWLLLVSLVGSIKTCLVVMPSYRNDVGLWNFSLL